MQGIGVGNPVVGRGARIDHERWPNCGGELKVVAAILEAPVIEWILTHPGVQELGATEGLHAGYHSAHRHAGTM